MNKRQSFDVQETYVIIRGLLSKGINLYGPFSTINDAISYGNKNFPDDTREITIMRKEIITHGEE